MPRRPPVNRAQALTSPGAFRALTSPHRVDAIAALADAGQASIADLARRLGRTPHSLHYHMRKLAEGGVIVPAETRRRGRRDEVVWKLAANRFVAEPSRHAPPGLAAAASKAADAMLRLTARELQQAIRQEYDGGGVTEPVIGLRMKGRFDRQTLQRIRRLIRQIESTVRRANQSPPKGRVCALTVVMVPADDRTRRTEP